MMMMNILDTQFKICYFQWLIITIIINEACRVTIDQREVNDEMMQLELMRPLGFNLRLLNRVEPAAGAPGLAAVSSELGVVGRLGRNLCEKASSRREVEFVNESGFGSRVPWRWDDPVGSYHAMLATFPLHLGMLKLS